MNQFYKLLFFLFFLPSFALAQSNYKPGYVVKLNGDTVKGYINYREWNKNPDEFIFKNGLTDSIQKKYSANDAATVVISDLEVYKRATLEISNDEVTESRAGVGLNKKTAVKTVFLKLVNRGKNVTLYEYSDDVKDRFFIDENTGKPVELTLNVYLMTSSSTDATREDIYKRQLQSLAVKYQAEDHSLIARIQESDYIKADIEDDVFKINGADNATTFSSTKKFRSRPFAGLGLEVINVHNYTANDFGGLYTHDAIGYKVHTAVETELNLGEDIYFSQSKRSAILRTAVHFSYGSGSNVKGISSDSLLLKYSTIPINLNINTSLLLNIYSSNHTAVYLGGGIAIYVHAGASGKYLVKDYNYLPVATYFSSDFTFTTSAQVIFDNKIDVYGGYDPVSTIGQRINTLSAFHLGVNYLFGEHKN